MLRVLRPKGLFFCISLGAHLELQQWPWHLQLLEHQALRAGGVSSVYVFQKTMDLDLDGSLGRPRPRPCFEA